MMLHLSTYTYLTKVVDEDACKSVYAARVMVYSGSVPVPPGVPRHIVRSRRHASSFLFLEV